MRMGIFLLVITLATTNGQIISQVIVAIYGLLSPKTCCSFDSDAAQVNEFDLKYNSECFISSYNIIHLMLEENVTPLYFGWNPYWQERYKPIFIDVQVEFGIHSSKNSLVIHKCFLNANLKEFIVIIQKTVIFHFGNIVLL